MSNQQKQAKRLSYLDKNSLMVICSEYADDKDLLFCCIGKGNNGWTASFLDRELYLIFCPIVRKGGALCLGRGHREIKVKNLRTKTIFTNNYEKTLKFWDSVPECVTIREMGSKGEVRVNE